MHWIIIASHFVLATIAAGHALLFKRDPKAALGWIAVCLLFPLVGSLLYYLFGINRIRTRARKLHHLFSFQFDKVSEKPPEPPPTGLRIDTHLLEIVKISSAVAGLPIVGGNTIKLLHNGEQAYPEMIAAIDTARTSLFLSTYIFETNKTGRMFIEALAKAHLRGVDVRVIIDGLGEWYALPRASSLLQKRGVPTTRFLPPKLFPPEAHINLRNHRKILVADGMIGFIGGINIGDRHLTAVLENPNRVEDVHFRLTGPVVNQIENAFLSDWAFCTGAPVPPYTPPETTDGKARCRTIVDGPNENHGKLSTILFGAVTTARHRIWIMTPYFLPSREIITALKNAALRGVEINILLPAKSNLPYVQWATNKMLWELLLKGIRIFLVPPPFVHSKLLMIDDHYAQIGSANLDPRSLRLNFELVVEIYDRTAKEVLCPYFEKTMARSRQVTLEEVDSRSISVRTRDALAWLFSPYL